MENKSRKSITATPLGGLYLVISEPGDATLYDYLVFRDGPDDFCFMPRRSTFRFPQRINWWEIERGGEKWDEEIIEIIAKREHCNPYTVMECVRTMREINNTVFLR